MVAGLSAAVSLLVISVAVVSSVAAWRIRNDRDTISSQNISLVIERDRASLAEGNERQAKNEYRAALWQSHLSRARAIQSSGLVGRRFASLEALREATSIQQADELRDEAITCLTLADLKRVRGWPENVPLAGETALDCDGAMEQFAARDGDGDVTIRRIPDSALVARLPSERRQVDFLRFSPDGQRIATLYRGGRLTVRVIGDGKKLLDVRGEFHRTGIEFSPDGAELAAARRDNSVDVFSLSTGTSIGRLKCPHPAWHARFHPRYPRSRQLAVCMGGDRAVGIWALDGEPRAKYVTFPARIQDVAWDHEGRRLVAAGDDSDVHVYDTMNGEHSSLPEGHSFVASGVAANPRLPLAATSGQDGQSFLWNLDAKHMVLRLEGTVVRWSNDGRRLAVRSGPHAGIWEWEPARESRLFHFTKRSANKVQRTAFHPRLPIVAAAGPDGVRLWRAPFGEPLGKVGAAHTYDVAFNPRDGAIFVNDVDGLSTWPVAAESERNTIKRVRIGPRRRLELPAGANETRGIAIDASGNTLVTTWPRRPAALVVDLPTGAVKQIPTLPQVRYLALDATGRYAALGTNKGQGVDVWDLLSPSRAATLDSPGSAWPQFNSDGTWLAASGPGGYRVWEVGTWREVMTLPREHELSYGLMAFFPGEAIAAVACSRSSVQIVDLTSRRVLANLEPAQRPPELLDLDISSDGSMLVVAQGNGGVRLWNLALIQRQLTAMGHRFDLPLRGKAPDGIADPLEVVIDPGPVSE
jgi:WD40 repeat protein